MLPLFDLPPEEIAPKQKKLDPYRYYLWIEHNGKKLALMASHENGGCEVCEVSELTRQPKLYNSYAGATQAKHYHQRMGDGTWNIERWNPALKKRT